MGQLTIRDIDDTLLVQLKRKAWQEGLPLETFVRRLLMAGVETEELDTLHTPPGPLRFVAQADAPARWIFHA